jgi:dipeptidyl aminopeptidase/acylaminoacyl peptidase
VAVHRHDANGGNIVVLEKPPRAPTPITFEAKYDNSSPIWSPNGERIVFVSQRNGKWGLYQTRSDGSGAEELLLESELRKAPMSWSPDGKHLVYWVQDPKTAGDLWVLPMDGDKKSDKQPEVFLATPADETHAQVSPDGKWIAYSSNLTSRKEVWVRPFPSGLGQWQISPDASTFGGDWPRWNRSTKDSTELFYHSTNTSFTGGPYSNPDGFQGPIFSVALKATGDALVVASPLEVDATRPHGRGRVRRVPDRTAGAWPDSGDALVVRTQEEGLTRTNCVPPSIPAHLTMLSSSDDWERRCQKNDSTGSTKNSTTSTSGSMASTCGSMASTCGSMASTSGSMASTSGSMASTSGSRALKPTCGC